MGKAACKKWIRGVGARLHVLNCDTGEGWNLTRGE